MTAMTAMTAKNVMTLRVTTQTNTYDHARKEANP